MALSLKNLMKVFRERPYKNLWMYGKYQDLAEGFPLRVIPTQFFFDRMVKPFLPSDPEIWQMTISKTKDNDTHVFTVHEGA